MAIGKSPENSGSLIKIITKKIRNKTKKGAGFLGILWGTLGPSLLVNMLADKSVIRREKGTIGAEQTF